MKEDMFQREPEDLPSPEELFHTDYEVLETVSAKRRKPIPRYREVKLMSTGFLAVMLGLVVLFFMLDLSGFHFYYMASDSMDSRIPVNSLLLVRETDTGRLEPGDIITFMNQKGICVTHEISAVLEDYEETGEPAFWTQGTENERLDDEVVTSDRILGKVICHIPYIGRLFRWSDAG